MRVSLSLPFLACVACSTPPTADPAAVVGVLEGQREAWNRGDIDAFKRSQDGLIVADEMASVCGGIEAFKAR